MSTKPKIKTDDLLYRLLRDGHVVEFNEKKAQGMTTDLTHCDFRGVDLRGLDAAGLDFTGPNETTVPFWRTNTRSRSVGSSGPRGSPCDGTAKTHESPPEYRSREARPPGVIFKYGLDLHPGRDDFLGPRRFDTTRRAGVGDLASPQGAIGGRLGMDSCCLSWVASTRCWTHRVPRLCTSCIGSVSPVRVPVQMGKVRSDGSCNLPRVVSCRCLSDYARRR